MTLHPVDLPAKFGAEHVGVILSGASGQTYNDVRLIRLAVDHGYVLGGQEQNALLAYARGDDDYSWQGESYAVTDMFGHGADLTSEALDYLNMVAVEDGYTLEWVDGDLSLTDDVEPFESPTEDEYDEMLDEVYPPISMGGYSWDASCVLKRMDPVAYRCGYADYVSSRAEDWEYENPGRSACQ